MTRSATTTATRCAERYARRAAPATATACCGPTSGRSVQERQRAMLALFARAGLARPVAAAPARGRLRRGGNLLELLRLGFAPEHLSGIELLPERLAQARARAARGAAR